MDDIVAVWRCGFLFVLWRCAPVLLDRVLWVRLKKHKTGKALKIA